MQETMQEARTHAEMLFGATHGKPPEGGKPIGMKERAKLFANVALTYRVEGREWETACAVARKMLELVDGLKLVPTAVALETAVQALRKGGFEIVRKAERDELIKAMDEFGMNKTHATDSPKLAAVKRALSMFRMSSTLL